MGWKLEYEEGVRVKRIVEREPMWDGNERVGTDVQSVKRVEREPMWDGNESSTIAGTYFLR